MKSSSETLQRQQVVFDASELPTVVFGHRAPLFWGALLFAVVEAFTIAVCLAAWFYLRRNFPAWPPEGTPQPRLVLPTVALLIFIASLFPAHLADRAARQLDRQRVLLWTVVHAGLGLVVVGLRWFEFSALGTKWNEHAYGSIAWATLGFHTTMLLLETITNVGLAAIFLAGKEEPKHYPNLGENALYWYFTFGTWVPIYVIVFWGPRWW